MGPTSRSDSGRTRYLLVMVTDHPNRERYDQLEPDPVIEAYKQDLDRTLLRENLTKSVTERVANLLALQRLAAEGRAAGRRAAREP